ncbi:MAG: hypothetical protein QG584_393 [Pseudomonadota bacterium]|jgi:hypothetical protein|nr:hypothetical protein [Pseudomonadota bacterium]MDQ5907229.1 hypothetical protein [Pseudomonadota bacterium]MDQ5914511.1 hypothetical protein [Pseudomonadota bacterium]MDQ5918725.1 hypothetical protein [Pseudomonadota bacterium]
MMKKLALPLLLLPLLSGCINDGIAMRIDGPEHAISLLRGQKVFWEKKMDLEVVVARMPDCQRRFSLEPAAVSPSFKVDVYMTGPNAFLLEQGKYLYSVETQTCQKFEKLAAPPEGGKGEMVGVFREEGGKLVFVAAQQPK